MNNYQNLSEKTEKYEYSVGRPVFRRTWFLFCLFGVEERTAKSSLPLVKGHVVNVFWIDTVNVQNNLPTEFSKKKWFS